jgi:hypothetical protein
MAFMKSNGVVVSFAKYQDVVDKDATLFQDNEGLSEEVITPSLKRATERILTQLRATDWWRNYFTKRDSLTIVNSVADIPALDANKIIFRFNDFTELCVSVALSEYIYPKVADFSNEETSERQKMAYYAQRSEKLFVELITAGDFYDFDGSGAISSDEKAPGYINLKRVR